MFRKKQLISDSPLSFYPNVSNLKQNATISQSRNSKHSTKGIKQQFFTGQPPINKSKFKQSSNNHKPSKHHSINEDSILSDSSLSFYDYKEIITNLLDNSHNDEQWNRTPETIKLMIKALSLSLNSIENKIIETREIINDQGIKNSENSLQMSELREQIRKDQELIRYLMSVHEQREENDRSEEKQRHIMSRNKFEDGDIYSKGLDIIMIQEVKTIADALISKKYEQILNDFRKLQQYMYHEKQQQNEILKGQVNQTITENKTQLKINQLNQNINKNQRMLKERIIILEMETQHIKKQLKDGEIAILNLGQYVEREFCMKSQIDLLNKQIEIMHSKKTNNQSLFENSLLKKSYLEEIVNNQIKVQDLLKKRQFQDFREKINKEISRFPDIKQIQNIISKAQSHKTQSRGSIDRYKQNIFHSPNNSEKNNKKKTKYIKSVKLQKKTPEKEKFCNEKPPQMKKKVTSASQSQIMLKQKKHSYKGSLIHQKSLSKDLDQTSLSHKKRSPSPQRKNKLQAFQTSTATQKRLQQLTLSMKSQIIKHLQSQLKRLDKKHLKRLQSAQQQFCNIVEQNWKAMTSQKQIILKSQRQNLQNLLKIFSNMNIVVRYTTLINTKPNQLVKWQREDINVQQNAFRINKQKTNIHITTHGLYQVHLVLYSTYDPKIVFGVELNYEEIYTNLNKEGLKSEVKDSLQINERQRLFSISNKQEQKSSHPSRGIWFSQVIMIPSKSNLTVRVLSEFNGQGFLQIRKM